MTATTTIAGSPQEQFPFPTGGRDGPSLRSFNLIGLIGSEYMRPGSAGATSRITKVSPLTASPRMGLSGSGPWTGCRGGSQAVRCDDRNSAVATDGDRK